MAVGEITRITSADLIVEFQPALFPKMPTVGKSAYAPYNTPQNHVTVLSINGATTGTFKLAVNGFRTAALEASASLEAADIEDALEALPNVGAGNITVTGDPGGDFTITAGGALENEFLVIEIVDDTTAPGVTQVIQTQGSKWYPLQGETSNFSYTDTQETTDTTGINEKERRHSTTVSDATFELSLYEALMDYRGFLDKGVEGYLRVFEHGKTVGSRYFAWEVMLTEVSSNFPSFDKVEISISGRRQGAPIARVGSHWEGD